MNRFREIVSEPDQAQLEQDLRDWGYPRELVPGESEVSWWFRFGPHMIFWFHEVADRVLAFHVCAQPGHSPGFTRRFVIGAEIIAELIGATHVRVNVPKGRDELTGYLRRLGWCATPEGMTKTLGGE